MLKFPFMCRTLLFRGEKCCWYQSHSGACSQTINNNTYSCFPMHSAGIKAVYLKSRNRERNVMYSLIPLHGWGNQGFPGGRHRHCTSTEPSWLLKMLLLLTDKYLASTEELTSRCLNAGNSDGKCCLLGVCFDLLWEGNTAVQGKQTPAPPWGLTCHPTHSRFLCFVLWSRLRSARVWKGKSPQEIQPHSAVCCFLLLSLCWIFGGQSKDTSVCDAKKPF